MEPPRWCRWTAAARRRCWRGSPAGQAWKASANSSSIPRMQWRWRKPRDLWRRALPARFPLRSQRTDVLPRLQVGRDAAAAAVGHNLPLGALRAAVLLQLLVGDAGASHRPSLEPAELSPTAAHAGVSANPAALGRDCRAGDAAGRAARISAGVFSVVSRWAGE